MNIINKMCADENARKYRMIALGKKSFDILKETYLSKINEEKHKSFLVIFKKGYVVYSHQELQIDYLYSYPTLGVHVKFEIGQYTGYYDGAVSFDKHYPVCVISQTFTEDELVNLEQSEKAKKFLHDVMHFGSEYKR